MLTAAKSHLWCW